MAVLNIGSEIQGSLFSEKLIIGRNFALQNGLGLIKTEKKNSLKQLKSASNNSPWAYMYIREGLLWEGFLHLRFGGLIFGSQGLFWGGGEGGRGGLLSEFTVIFEYQIQTFCSVVVFLRLHGNTGQNLSTYRRLSIKHSCLFTS